MKLNRKGFTLVEILAVIVILAMLMAIMVPTVGKLLERSREDNYQNLMNSIIQAAKTYMSDHRYDVKVSGSCSANVAELSIEKIGDEEISGDKLKIQNLVDEGNITTNADGDIIDPRDDSLKLDLENSYVIVKYSCVKKDFSYSASDIDTNDTVKTLFWIQK